MVRPILTRSASLRGVNCRWLRNKRNARFKPELAKISEADSSALEESSSAGYIGKTDRANEKNADGAKGPQARLMGMAAFKGVRRRHHDE